MAEGATLVRIFIVITLRTVEEEDLRSFLDT